MDVEVKVTTASAEIAATHESTKTTLPVLVHTFIMIAMLMIVSDPTKKQDDQDQVRHGDATSTQREPKEIRPRGADGQQHNEDIWET